MLLGRNLPHHPCIPNTDRTPPSPPCALWRPQSEPGNHSRYVLCITRGGLHVCQRDKLLLYGSFCLKEKKDMGRCLEENYWRKWSVFLCYRFCFWREEYDSNTECHQVWGMWLAAALGPVVSLHPPTLLTIPAHKGIIWTGIMILTALASLGHGATISRWFLY